MFWWQWPKANLPSHMSHVKFANDLHEVIALLAKDKKRVAQWLDP